MNDSIYQQLQVVAKSKECTYYSNIARLANLNMSFPKDRNELADILGDISSREHEQGSPLLSAVVVLKSTGKPGVGFFGLADSLGLFDGQDREKFWRNERDKVWEHWG